MSSGRRPSMSTPLSPSRPSGPSRSCHGVAVRATIWSGEGNKEQKLTCPWKWRSRAIPRGTVRHLASSPMPPTTQPSQIRTPFPTKLEREPCSCSVADSQVLVLLLCVWRGLLMGRDSWKIWHTNLL